jgi:hypothetical protein
MGDARSNGCRSSRQVALCTNATIYHPLRDTALAQASHWARQRQTARARSGEAMSKNAGYGAHRHR